MTSSKMFSALSFVLATALVAAPAGQAQDQNQNQAPRVQIFVDQRCGILPESDPAIVGDHEAAFRDGAICHLESVLSSHHVEEKIDDSGARSHFFVRIAEQEYLLLNPTDHPAVFVVRQNVPENWTVDSDPQPDAMDGSTAIFKVNADPGQRVRLHVGLRNSVSMDK
jgi:hypothetical protein